MIKDRTTQLVQMMIWRCIRSTNVAQVFLRHRVYKYGAAKAMFCRKTESRLPLIYSRVDGSYRVKPMCLPLHAFHRLIGMKSDTEEPRQHCCVAILMIINRTGMRPLSHSFTATTVWNLVQQILINFISFLITRSRTLHCNIQYLLQNAYRVQTMSRILSYAIPLTGSSSCMHTSYSKMLQTVFWVVYSHALRDNKDRLVRVY